MNALSLRTEETEIFDATVVGSPEPVRRTSIELGGLTSTEDHRPIAEDEGESTTNHIHPFEPGVSLQRPELRRLPTIDDVLERLHPDRPAAEGQDRLVMELPRRDMNARIPDRRSPHQFIEREPIDPGQRQQQLQARLALPGFQTGQRTRRHPSQFGHLFQSAPLLLPQSSQAGADASQRLSNGLLSLDRRGPIGEDVRYSVCRMSSPLTRRTAIRPPT